MKKIILISTFLVIFLIWGLIHALLTSTPDFAALHEEDVILYATSWCPNCAKTRKFLKANNIPYFEYDVEKSSEGRSQFKQLHGTGVPVILVKNNVIRGYDPDAIMHAVKINQISQ